MFESSANVASRLFVRDAAGQADEIGRYEAWKCDGPLDFAAALPPSCLKPPFTAYDDIVRDHIQSHPAREDDAEPREELVITRRIFAIPDPLGPVEITDCPLLHCTARRRSTSFWTPRL